MYNISIKQTSSGFKKMINYIIKRALAFLLTYLCLFFGDQTADNKVPIFLHNYV